MGLNVSMDYTYQLDNKENLKNAAKNILNRGGASSETVQKIVEQTIFNNDRALKEIYTNPQLNALKASTQITISNSLKETLKYLRTHSAQKQKKTPIFGELWNIFEANNEASEENPYKGELYDFQIDKNAKNIFAA